MRRFLLLTLTLAVLGLSTAGFGMAYHHELGEVGQLVADTEESKVNSDSSLHFDSHYCHIGAHLTALPSHNWVSPFARPLQAAVVGSVDIPPSIFPDRPLRPPRTPS